MSKELEHFDREIEKKKVESCHERLKREQNNDNVFGIIMISIAVLLFIFGSIVFFIKM